MTTIEITTDDIAAVDGSTLDAWLSDPETVPTENTVYLCIDGKARREYEEVKARIAERRDAAVNAALEAWAAAAQGAAAGESADTRLASKAGAKKPGPAPTEDSIIAGLPRDKEQDHLEALVKRMKGKTVKFIIRAVGTPRWNELVALHPPRKEPDTGRIDPRDRSGMNSSTFYVALVRESIVSPEMTDARYASLLPKLTDVQFDKLAQAAADANRGEEDDLPF